VIRIEVQLSEGTVQPNNSVVAAAVEKRVNFEVDQAGRPRWQGPVVKVQASEVAITVIEGSDPIFTPGHSRGGNRLRLGTSDQCTSGWSVSGPHGDGIITAGHCTVDRFVQPGVTPYPLTLRAEVYGAGGDVEYLTSAAHLELAEFYADATSIRDVTSIEPTATMVGDSVCFYGRESNTRTCNHNVEAWPEALIYGGVTVGNLARASNNSGIEGDSGGGWSLAWKAYGVWSGYGSGPTNLGKSYFTPVEQAQNALNVTIKLK
jgi:hypothetical protein